MFLQLWHMEGQRTESSQFILQAKQNISIRSHKVSAQLEVMKELIENVFKSLTTNIKAFVRDTDSMMDQMFHRDAPHISHF